MKSKIKIELTQKRWDELSELLSIVAKKAPISGLATESCLLAEYYQANIKRFAWFTPNKHNNIIISLKTSEAYALYYLLSDDRIPQRNPVVLYLIVVLSNSLKISK